MHQPMSVFEAVKHDECVWLLPRNPERAGGDAMRLSLHAEQGGTLFQGTSAFYLIQ